MVRIFFLDQEYMVGIQDLLGTQKFHMNRFYFREKTHKHYIFLVFQTCHYYIFIILQLRYNLKTAKRWCLGKWKYWEKEESGQGRCSRKNGRQFGTQKKKEKMIYLSIISGKKRIDGRWYDGLWTVQDFVFFLIIYMSI